MSAAAATATPGGEAVLALAWPLDLRLTVASHGWVQLAPWRWDAGIGVLARAEHIGGQLGAVSISQRDRRAIRVQWSGLTDAELGEILRRVGRWIGADWPPDLAAAALGGEAAALIAAGGGRILRCSSFYEDFVKTVLTINTSWAATCRMTAALVAEPGGGTFPGPQQLLDYGEERLRREAKLGFRAATIMRSTARLVEDGMIDAAGDGEAENLGHDYLLSLPGIGPYAAAHCRLLLHDFARLPVDSSVVAYLRERHGCTPEAYAAERAQWGDHLALGYRLARLRDRLDREGP